MWSLHGFSLLRRPLPLLVTSLVLSGVLFSSSGASALCEVSCCSVWPTCDTARRVTCDCPNINKMTLHKGDIPETVRAVEILNTNYVIIDKYAINGLPSLTNFTLIDTGKLKIKQDGMSSQNQSMLRSVTFQNVGLLQVESKAFSGDWQQHTSIRMHHIGRLDVESNALDYQVTVLGPRVSLQHVEMLNLKPNGLAASITELTLYNVTMDVCHGGSFGGNTSYTELNKVNIGKAKARCFHGQNELATFNIRYLKMQTAHRQAFSGNIRELTIKDSHFTTIQKRGFDIHVKQMQVNNTYIEELRSNGLSVIAKLDIRLEYLRFDDLRRNALAGLRMGNSLSGAKQCLNLNQFQIRRAENGSLALSESANLQILQINYMYVISRMNPVCPAETWARVLTGSSPSNPLSIAQHAVFKALIGNKRCKDNVSVFKTVLDLEPHEEFVDDQRHLDDLDSTNDSQRSGAVMSTADTILVGDGPDPESGRVQPHESEEEAASNDPQDPFLTNSREEVNHGGTHGAGIRNNDKHRTQVLTLGVMLSLAVVLVILLMVLLLRSLRSRQPDNNRTLALETLPGVLTDHLLGGDDNHEESSCSRVQTGNTGSSNQATAPASSRPRTTLAARREAIFSC